MILTVASYKGGVGKTTTAVHLAAYLNSLSPALLLDGDQIKTATGWSLRGTGFPFRVAPIDHAAMLARQYEHIVIDTGQRPSAEDLQAAAEGCDLMVVPSFSLPLEADGLGQTVRALQAIPGAKFRVLLTKVAPDELREAAELRELLASIEAPVFAGQIPRLKAFSKAAGAGTTVDQAQDKNAKRGWAAYACVGKELGL